MGDHSTADMAFELSRLAAIQEQLRALERGASVDPGRDLVSVGVRRRLAGRALTDRIRKAREQEALRGLQQVRQQAAELAASAEQRARQQVEQRGGPARPAIGGLPVFWSPEPVLGFRAWNVADRLYGARAPWPTPELTARCLHRWGRPGDDDDVPHITGCGRPPCGIYAVKGIDRLVDAIGLPGGRKRWAYGLVELTGKVVEHDHGYRAKRARCLAVAVVSGEHLIRVEGAELPGLFRNPQHTLTRTPAADPEVISALPRGRDAADDLITYLEEARLLHQALGTEPPGGTG